MPEKGIDTERAYKEWKERKHNSWLFFVFLLIVVVVVSAVGMRFLKPPAVISLLVTITVLQGLVFLNSGRIVIALMGCVLPDKDQEARLRPLLEQLVERSGLGYTPTLFISKMEVPNAFAFGSGIMGGSGVAVTEPLLEILNDDCAGVDPSLDLRDHHLAGSSLARWSSLPLRRVPLRQALRCARQGNQGMAQPDRVHGNGCIRIRCPVRDRLCQGSGMGPGLP